MPSWRPRRTPPVQAGDTGPFSHRCWCCRRPSPSTASAGQLHRGLAGAGSRLCPLVLISGDCGGGCVVLPVPAQALARDRRSHRPAAEIHRRSCGAWIHVGVAPVYQATAGLRYIRHQAEISRVISSAYPADQVWALRSQGVQAWRLDQPRASDSSPPASRALHDRPRFCHRCRLLPVRARHWLRSTTRSPQPCWGP